MNNHYFANDAVINDQHKELNIHGNLTTQQVVMIAKDFFAEGTEEKNEEKKEKEGKKEKKEKKEIGRAHV